MTDKRRIFEVGDTIAIDSCAGFKGRGQIQAIRHEVGNTRLGTLSLGADVLRADGKVSFYFLHNIARWNAEALKPLTAARL
jgi:hypothetical protein